MTPQIMANKAKIPSYNHIKINIIKTGISLKQNLELQKGFNLASVLILVL